MAGLTYKINSTSYSISETITPNSIGVTTGNKFDGKVLNIINFNGNKAHLIDFPILFSYTIKTQFYTPHEVYPKDAETKTAAAVTGMTYNEDDTNKILATENASHSVSYIKGWYEYSGTFGGTSFYNSNNVFIYTDSPYISSITNSLTLTNGTEVDLEAAGQAYFSDGRYRRKYTVSGMFNINLDSNSLGTCQLNDDCTKIKSVIPAQFNVYGAAPDIYIHGIKPSTSDIGFTQDSNSTKKIFYIDSGALTNLMYNNIGSLGLGATGQYNGTIFEGIEIGYGIDMCNSQVGDKISESSFDNGAGGSEVTKNLKTHVMLALRNLDNMPLWFYMRAEFMDTNGIAFYHRSIIVRIAGTTKDIFDFYIDNNDGANSTFSIGSYSISVIPLRPILGYFRSSTDINKAHVVSISDNATDPVYTSTYQSDKIGNTLNLSNTYTNPGGGPTPVFN